MEFFVGIPVASFAEALVWYERLIGRASDLLDGDHAAVWDLDVGRSLYIENNPEHVGHMLFTMYVDDLDEFVAQIAERGIEPSNREHIDSDPRMVNYLDPDGNEITFGWYQH